MDAKNLETHIQLAGWLNIANGAFSLLIGGLFFLGFAGFGLFAGDRESLGIMLLLAAMIGLLMLVLSLPSLLAGYGMLRHKNWGRLLGIIVSIFNLLSFPIGTALGAYTLWVLLQGQATDYFMPLKTA